MLLSRTLDIGVQNNLFSCMNNQHAGKATVWCGVATFGIIGSHFFEEIFVNAQTFVAAELRLLGVENKKI